MSTETLERPTEMTMRDTCETYHLVLRDDLVAICGERVQGLDPRRGDQMCVMCFDLAQHR